jgi:transcriptional regulator with XRE-family HTH domain
MTGDAKPLDVRSKIIGVLLRSARLKAGKTLKDCADLLDCSTHTISQYEYGRSGISLPELELLAGFFQIPVGYFWEEESTAFEESLDLPPSGKLIPLRQKMIGVLLRQTRLEAGKTQKECSEILDVSSDTISKYEYGKKPVPFTQLELLASFLGVPLFHFLDRGLVTSRVSISRSGDELLSAEEAWASLPTEVQEFIRLPDSLPYLQMALRLYELPKDSLKRVATTMLSLEE